MNNTIDLTHLPSFSDDEPEDYVGSYTHPHQLNTKKVKVEHFETKAVAASTPPKRSSTTYSPKQRKRLSNKTDKIMDSNLECKMSVQSGIKMLYAKKPSAVSKEPVNISMKGAKNSVCKAKRVKKCCNRELAVYLHRHIIWTELTKPRDESYSKTTHQYKIEKLAKIIKTIENCNISIVKSDDGDYGNIQGVGPQFSKLIHSFFLSE